MTVSENPHDQPTQKNYFKGACVTYTPRACRGHYFKMDCNA